MAKLSILAGATSKLLDVFIQDSSSTTGAGLTGLAFNTASLTAYYYREGAASTVAITLATMTLGTWATGGFIVVDGTNMPGCYQLGIPNAAIAAGAKSVIVLLKGAANMAPLVLEIELTAVDNQDSVRGGMTALPNAAAGANGGLPLGDASGRVDIGKLLGTAWLTPAVAGTPDVNAKQIGGTAQTAKDIGAAVPAAAPGAAGGLTIAGSNAATTFATLTVTGAMSINGTGNVAQTGDSFVRIGATGSGLTSLALSATALSTAQWTNGRATNLDNLDATVSSRLASASYTAPLSAGATANAVWDEAIAGHLGAGSTGAKLNAAASAGDPWATALPGAYAAGTAGKILGTNLDATVSSRSTFAGGAVASVTGNVGGNVVGSVNSVVGTVTVGTVNDKTGYSLSATGLNSIVPAEPSAPPAFGTPLPGMVAWLLVMSRNKITQTMSTQLVRNDADSATIGTSTDSDDGTTFTRGKFT